MKIFSSIITAIALLSCQLSFSQLIITGSDTAKVNDEPVILRLNDYKGDIQWQKTEDQTNWQDISGANEETLEIGILKTMSYRARVTVGNCDPFYSDVTKLEILDGPQISIEPLVSSLEQGKTLVFSISISSGAGLKSLEVNNQKIKNYSGEKSDEFLYKYIIPYSTPTGELTFTFHVSDNQYNPKEDTSITIIDVLPAPTPSISIQNTVLNEVNDKIFGHFMEKCSWSNEIGGDLVIDPNTGEFDPTVLDHLKSMSIPIIRYPGGTDVDYYDWTILIDNAPGQTERKPYRTFKDRNDNSVVSDNRLGMHEFFELCTTLGAEPLYVINLGDAFFKKISLQEAKEKAAALYAYCNMEEVETGTDWPGYRKMNGHEKPFNVKYFQIGNETWVYGISNWSNTTIDPQMVHLYDCITAIADTLKALNPDVQIIADGCYPQLIEMLNTNKYKKIDYVVFHSYSPWGIDAIRKDDDYSVAANKISTIDTWHAWVSTPNIDDKTGFSITQNSVSSVTTLESSFDVAVTEWNWNGWYEGAYSKAGLAQPDLAKGIGAAGFLHGFMRDGDKIKIACQSMTVGKSWGITGIRVDPSYRQKAVTLPSGQVTGLYSTYHGNELIKTTYNNIPTYSQPYQMKSILPHDKVAYLDILTTKSDTQIFIHIINRSFDKDYSLDVNFQDMTVSSKYSRFSLIGDNTARLNNRNLKQIANIIETKFENASKQCTVEVPHSSVSVFVFDVE